MQEDSPASSEQERTRQTIDHPMMLNATGPGDILIAAPIFDETGHNKLLLMDPTNFKQYYGLTDNDRIDLETIRELFKILKIPPNIPELNIQRDKNGKYVFVPSQGWKTTHVTHVGNPLGDGNIPPNQWNTIRLSNNGGSISLDDRKRLELMHLPQGNLLVTLNDSSESSDAKIVMGQGMGIVVKPGQLISVGRDTENTLQILGANISRTHLHIINTGKDTLFRDSTNSQGQRHATIVTS